MLALGGAGFLVWQYALKESMTREPVTNQQALAQSAIGEVIDKAEESVSKNDYASAYALIDAEIEKTTDNSVKANLISSKASIAVEEKNLDKALDLSLAAYDVYPSNVTAQRVADKYAILSDKIKALEYYRLAIQLTGEDESINYVRYYETKIAELEQQ